MHWLRLNLPTISSRSELLERFLGSNGLGHLQHIESDSLGQGTTLSHGHKVTQVDVTETGRHVCGEGLVSLVIPLVLLDEMKVIPSQHNSSIHLHRFHNSREDTTSDADIPGERTFLINVGSFYSLSWCFEAQAHVLHEALIFCFHGFSDHTLLVEEDGCLFLERSLRLFRHGG